MLDASQSFLFIEFLQLIIQIKRGIVRFLQRIQGVGKLPAVIIDLHHLFDTFQADHVLIGKPSGAKHFVRRPAFVQQTVRFLVFLHIRALQHL